MWLPPVLSAQLSRTPAPHTIAQFGGADDDPTSELINARQAIRTDDGRYVVANGKPLAVRVYRANGQVERHLGRVGEGPGEYQGGVSLDYSSGDSVAVFSSSGRRWMVFRLNGDLLREWSVPAHPGPQHSILLQGSTLLRTGILGSRGCAASLISRWPTSSTTPHDAMTDPWGRLWIRPLSATDWTVLDRRGGRVATVTLPRGMWVTQFRGDTVVGLRVDADGFTHVHAIATGAGPSVGAPGPDCAAGEIPVTPVRSAMMRTALRNSVTFGESYLSREGRYPAQPALLPPGVRVEGAEPLILAATRDSWVIAIRDAATGYHCLMSIGPNGLPGIVDGVMRCGW